MMRAAHPVAHLFEGPPPITVAMDPLYNDGHIAERAKLMMGDIADGARVSALRQAEGDKAHGVLAWQAELYPASKHMAVRNVLTECGFLPEQFRPAFDHNGRQCWLARRFGSWMVLRYGMDPVRNDPVLSGLALRHRNKVGGIELTVLAYSSYIKMQVVDPTPRPDLNRC